MQPRNKQDLDRLQTLVSKERQAKQRDRYRIALLALPAYSPELNPIERLWAWLKSHQLSNRVYADYDDLLKSGTAAWNTLTPERLQTVCHASWLKRED